MLKGIRKSIQSIPLRNTATQVIAFCLTLSTASMMWNSLVLITGCESPVAVVLSGSMEPAFKRGDVLFLNMKKTPFYAGEVVVFKVEGRETPIVHRVIQVHRRANSDQVDLLTKGDNNKKDDSKGIYAKGQKYLKTDQVIGRARGYLPYIGYATIIMAEHPLVKYLLVGGLSIRGITAR